MIRGLLPWPWLRVGSRSLSVQSGNLFRLWCLFTVFRAEWTIR